MPLDCVLFAQVIQELGNPVMQRRHWERVCQAVGLALTGTAATRVTLSMGMA